MSMTQTAVSFILGASLSAGWVGAFSKATDDLKGLSENLKRGSAALDAFSASREKMENASAALRRNREQIGGEEPTRAQRAVLKTLEGNLRKTTEAFNASTRALLRLKDGWANAFSFSGIDAARKELTQAERALEKFQQKLKDKTPTADQIREQQRLAKNVALAREEFSRQERKVRDWRDAMNAAFINVARVTRQVRIADFSQKIAEQTAGLKSSFAALSEHARSFATLVTAGFVAGVSNTARTLDALARTAENLGVSTETLQRFQFAGTRAGISAEKLADYLTEMNKRVSEAAAGTGEAGKVLEELGLSAQALNGADAVRKFELIAKAMSKVENSADRARIADKLFGGEAVKTVPELVRRGWTQIAADMDAATDSILRNERATEISRAYIAAAERFRASLTTLWQEVAVNFMPAISSAMETLGGLFNNFHRFSTIISTGVIGFAAFKAATLGYATALSVVRGATVAWTIATNALTAAQWAWNVALSANPIGLVVAAVAGAALLIWKYWEPISEFFSGLFARLRAGCLAVVDWVRAGFSAAWEWLRNSAVYKAINELVGWFSSIGDSEGAPGGIAPAAPALSGADLETMSRAAISNSNNVRTDARTFNTNANFTIVQQPGEDAEALARRVSERLAESYDGSLAAAL